MPFLRYANARVVNHRLEYTGGWDNVRVASGKPRMDRNLVEQAEKILKAGFDPKAYLLTHATIVASVDTVPVKNARLGATIEGGKRIVRKTANYRIKADCDKYINNNLDSWARDVLLKSYKTFIGAHSFVEHVQIEDLSKGRIIDAVARDVGDSVYVDILVANDRKHTDLIEQIESGQLSTLSMGCSIDGSTCTKCGHWAADETEFCFPPGTRVLKSDGKYTPIEEIVEGDVVLTHTGAHRRVLHTMSRHHDGHVSVLKVDGVPTEIRATTNHPFWVLRPATHCSCGCGQPMRRTVEHESGSAAAFRRRFLPGHNSRVWNPSLGSKNVVSFEDYSTTFDLDFEFVPAKEVSKGDYVAFPIPQEVRNTDDATERRARLIGYFLAEGSFIKRDGERVGVEFTFGSHEADTLAAEVEALLNQEWGRDERRVSSVKWEALRDRKGVTPIRRRRNSRLVPADLTCPSCDAPSEYAYNARFKAGRDDCYSCKVCDRQWIEGADRAVKARLYPSTGENGGSCAVRLMSNDAADWFFRYCGEYAEGKQLPADVLLWSPEIQKHILLCWLNGDGSQSHTGVWGGTASFHLMSQMHVIAARCGWYSRKQVVFGNQTTDVRQVVNGPGEVVARDHRGWLPQFRLNVSDPVGFGSEIRWLESEKARVTLSSFTDGYKRVGNWMLYRVRETSVECYSGPVHNFEVEGDNSYVVEGVAVHNCDHIRYQKGNTFFDENGQRHRIAELCGDVSLDPTGGVTFIEASWVAVPAFTGAVARNIVSVDTGTSKGKKAARKIKRALDAPTRSVDPDAMKKAANFTLAEEDPFSDLSDSPTETAPAGSSADRLPLEDLRDQIKKTLLDKVKEDIIAEISEPKPKKEVVSPTATPTDPNDTIIKQAALARRAGLRVAYQAAVREIVKTASSDVDLVNRVATLNDEMGVSVPRFVYRAALKVGASDNYPTLQSFLSGCRSALGREPTGSEAKTLLRIASILAAVRSNRRHAEKLVKEK